MRIWIYFDIRRGVVEHVEILAAQERCDCLSMTNRQSGELEIRDIMDILLSYAPLSFMTYRHSDMHEISLAGGALGALSFDFMT